MDILQPSWRGKNISTRKDSQGTYTAMTGVDAMLYIPVNVAQNAIYKITLELAKKSGNGLIYCNIYGNKIFDFPHAKFLCDDTKWVAYTLELRTGSFPKTVPMIFRIWRKPNGTGSILIRRIRVELAETNSDKEWESEKPDLAKAMTSVIKEPIAPVEKPQILPPKKDVLPNKRFRERKPRTFRRSGYLKKRLKGGVVRQKTPPTCNVRKINVEPPQIDLEIYKEGDIKNSVIISVKDRLEFLDRTLYSYGRQTMPKEQFEIVIVDDGSKDDLLSLCKSHARRSGLQFQYIKIDTKKGAIAQKGFTPALSNNIGFKHARGLVLIVTGPETLQNEINMDETWASCQGPKAVYGYVYKSGQRFVDALRCKKSWHEHSFEDILSLPGAKEIRPNTSGFWWYYVAARKEYILKINGVDERYMRGICGEDDDFANRLNFLGLTLQYNEKITGIHQNHYREDKKDNVHSIRFDRKYWQSLRSHNLRLLDACRESCEPIANKNIDWGTENAVVYKEII